MKPDFTNSLLFKQRFVEDILKGRKTQTRRFWKKCRLRTGAFSRCKTNYFAEPFAVIKILEVYQGAMRDLTPDDAYQEGAPRHLSTVHAIEWVWNALEKIRGKPIDPGEPVWVISFRLATKEETNAIH